MVAIVTFLAAATLAAPVPKFDPVLDEPPPGPPPRVVALRPDAKGTVSIVVRRRGQQIQPLANGAGAVQVVMRTVTGPVGVAELADLKIATAGGVEVSVQDAARRLARGGVVLASTDGKPVHPGYLKLFRADVLVLVSPDLVNLPVDRISTDRPANP